MKFKIPQWASSISEFSKNLEWFGIFEMACNHHSQRTLHNYFWTWSLKQFTSIDLFHIDFQAMFFFCLPSFQLSTSIEACFYANEKKNPIENCFQTKFVVYLYQHSAEASIRVNRKHLFHEAGAYQFEAFDVEITCQITCNYKRPMSNQLYNYFSIQKFLCNISNVITSWLRQLNFDIGTLYDSVYNILFLAFQYVLSYRMCFVLKCCV